MLFVTVRKEGGSEIDQDKTRTMINQIFSVHEETRAQNTAGVSFQTCRPPRPNRKSYCKGFLCSCRCLAAAGVAEPFNTAYVEL